MTRWTNKEIARLKAAYDGVTPSRDELAALFPGRDIKAVRTRASDEGLIMRQPYELKWLRIAHQYFAGREAETRAAQ